MDIAIGAASWWIVGHAIANGDDSFRNSGMNGVFGTSGFGYIDAATVGKRRFGGQAEWFFGLSFAATSATIVSGCVETTAETSVNLHAIALSQLRGQRRVDGVEAPHRADAVPGTLS